MDPQEHLSLSELRQKIKEFKMKDTPKLSAKKSVLSEYATRVGILKAKVLASEPPKMPEAPVAPVVPKKKVADPLPEALKAPKAEVKSKKAPAKAEPPKKKGSPFSSFMAAHKGKGYSMSELAQMYKSQK
jgi:hypothetical protein